MSVGQVGKTVYVSGWIVPSTHGVGLTLVGIPSIKSFVGAPDFPCADYVYGATAEGYVTLDSNGCAILKFNIASELNSAIRFNFSFQTQ